MQPPYISHTLKNNFLSIFHAICCSSENHSGLPLAGMTLGNDDKAFFRRQTDIDIALRFGKTPLEVSADRIAITAFHTLRRLGNLKNTSKRKIEIIWNPTDDFDIGYIEVYPASTLLANKVSIKGYKQSEENENEYSRILPVNTKS